MNIVYALPMILGDTNIYAGFGNRVTATPLSAPSKGIKISIASCTTASSDAQLYTTMGGAVSFELDQGSTVTGSVYLNCWFVSILVEKGIPSLVADAQNLHNTQFPSGLSIPGYIAYRNVDAASFKKDITDLLHDHPRSQATYLKVWNDHHTTAWHAGTPSQTDLVSNCIEAIMLNLTAPLVEGNVKIGKAADNPTNPTDPNDPTRGVSINYEWFDTDQPSRGQVSPVPYIRVLPNSDDPTTPIHTSKWQNHPLVLAVANIVVPVDVYARFECFDPTSVEPNSRYVPLANVGVELRDYDWPDSDDVVASGTTDSTGSVHFTFTSLAAMSDEPNPDLYFAVLTNGILFPWSASERFPVDWSTKDRKAVDNSPGYYNDFSGSQLGTASKPLAFRVGFDYHIRITYQDHSGYSPTPEPDGRIGQATGGIPINIWRELNLGELIRYEDTHLVASGRLDRDGEFHGISFGPTTSPLHGNEVLYLEIPLEVEDATINMRRTYLEKKFPIQNIPIVFDTRDTSSSFAGITSEQSLGDPIIPFIVFIFDNDTPVNPAFYALKCVREFNEFIHSMTSVTRSSTNYVWPGKELAIELEDSSVDAAHTTGDTSIHVQGASRWRRRVYFHELSHVVMNNVTDIDKQGGSWEYKSPHIICQYSNEMQAMKEGWAEAFGMLIFEKKCPGPVRLSTLDDTKSGDTWSNWPTTFQRLNINEGVNVEGAFANAFYQIMNYRVYGNDADLLRLHESYNGYLSDTLYDWIRDSAIKDRFIDYLWRPLRAMLETSTGVPSLVGTEFIRKIKSINPSEWFRLQTEFVSNNMAIDTNITVTGVSLVGGGAAQGPKAGGTVIDITGTNFVDRHDVTYMDCECGGTSRGDTEASGMQVTFVDDTYPDGIVRFPATSLTVLSATTIRVTTPAFATAGTRKIVVKLQMIGNDVVPATQPATPLTFTYI